MPDLTDADLESQLRQAELTIAELREVYLGVNDPHPIIGDDPMEEAIRACRFTAGRIAALRAERASLQDRDNRIAELCRESARDAQPIQWTGDGRLARAILAELGEQP